MLLSHRFTLMNFFTPGKITEIKLSSKKHALWVRLSRFDQELENSMRTWWMYVWGGLSSYSRLFTPFEKLEAVVGICHNVFRLALNKNTRIFIFSDYQRFILLFVLQKVIQFFVINLQKRTVNHKRRVLISAVVTLGSRHLTHHCKRLEQLLDRSRYDSEPLSILIKIIEVWPKGPRVFCVPVLVSSQWGPNIVYVFPDPVCPYAKIVELKPFVTSVTHSIIISNFCYDLPLTKL